MVVPGVKTVAQVLSLPGAVLGLAADIRAIADMTRSLPEIERQMAAVLADSGLEVGHRLGQSRQRALDRNAADRARLAVRRT